MNFLLSGDFRFFWPASLQDFVTFPTAWDSSLNTGLGVSQLSSLWITSYFNFTAAFSKIGLSWDLIQLFFWILPAILFSFFSSFFLFKKLFRLNILYYFLSGIIYTLNTYFLMILTGGQLGVSLSYSFIPLVFLSFILLLEKPSVKKSLLSGFVLGLQLLFDPRITYILLAAIFLYAFFNPRNLSKNLFGFFLPFVTALLLNFFWILPLIVTKNSSFPTGYDSILGFKFLSFAKLENSIALLHPNWPENIFGKVYFLRPEFLMLPLVAFSSLLFKKNRNILFFSLLSLIGIFLAKGANEPFGFINEFLFQYFPGMKMFRDATKWYILIALGYSILIPFGIANIYNALKNFAKPVSKLFLSVVVAYLIFLTCFVVFYRVKNIPETKSVPTEYKNLNDFIIKDQSFFRTLWVPQWQRFGFFANNHPAIGRYELFGNESKKTIQAINKNKSFLQELAVKYIIVPYDSQGEIFLKDRKYSEKEYQKTAAQIAKIPWLKEVKGFGKIRVFEVPNPAHHFFVINHESKIINQNYKYVSPVEYRVSVKDIKKGDFLVFSESFDSHWQAYDQKQIVKSQKLGMVNSFRLPKDGTYHLKIYYQPQDWVNRGLIISALTLLSVLLVIFCSKAKKW